MEGDLDIHWFRVGSVPCCCRFFATEMANIWDDLHHVRTAWAEVTSPAPGRTRALDLDQDGVLHVLVTSEADAERIKDAGANLVATINRQNPRGRKVKTVSTVVGSDADLRMAASLARIEEELRG
jgi:hypothetical protein